MKASMTIKSIGIECSCHAILFTVITTHVLLYDTISIKILTLMRLHMILLCLFVCIAHFRGKDTILKSVEQIILLKHVIDPINDIIVNYMDSNHTWLIGDN